MHRLLERQIRRHLGAGVDIPESLRPLLAAIDAAYADYDMHQALARRALDEMSRELNERNETLRRERDELAALARRLEAAHTQLLHTEKMASIGQLAAGVAHEINNPIGFVNANLGSLRDCIGNLLAMLSAYEAASAGLPEAERAALAARRRALDIDYLTTDLPDLLAETRDGIDRVRKIVQDLKDFSHADEGVFNWADLHAGLDSTLNIVANEIKYKADVIREYGDLPRVRCQPSQLNQVFMNLLVNAAQAIDGTPRGTIRIRTGHENGQVWIEIADSGSGIAPEHLPRIFDPFFTTKPVGKGTGLGLALSYGIIQKHGGTIAVTSQPGQGTTFRITLPASVPAVESSVPPSSEPAPAPAHVPPSDRHQ